MVSEFRKHKLNYIFDTFFDVNKDGTIEYNDFEIAVDRIAKARGYVKDDANYTDLSERFTQIWIKLQVAADTDNDNQVSRDEWVKLWETSVNDDWKILYMEFMFRLQDTSGDGEIEIGEFIEICTTFGVPLAESKEAFKILTKGGSTTVDFASYSELWKQYFSSDDPTAAGNSLFGKTSFP